LAAYIVGKEHFGVFVTALSIAAIIGAQPANGLVTGMIRHLSTYDKRGQRLFYSTAMRMCSWAMVAIVGVGLATLLGGASFGIIERLLFQCLVPLLISLYPENQFFLGLTELRVQRRFRERTVWYAMRAILVVAFGLSGALVGGAVGFAWGYAVGNFLSYGILMVRRSEWMSGGYDKEMGQSLKKVWLHMSIAGVISLSGPYLNKIVLGFYHTYTDVADLFAASAIVFSFLVVVSCIGYVLLSLLARYATIADLPKAARSQLFVLVVASATLPAILLWVAGPVALRILFPSFGEKSEDLLRILVWAAPFASLVYLMRPFVLKFAPTKVTPLVNGLSLAGTLIPTVLLIPWFHATGAAWAVVVGQAVAGLLWTYYTIKLFWSHMQ